jgi:hypothetical protein
LPELPALSLGFHQCVTMSSELGTIFLVEEDLLNSGCSALAERKDWEQLVFVPVKSLLSLLGLVVFQVASRYLELVLPSWTLRGYTDYH